MKVNATIRYYKLWFRLPFESQDLNLLLVVTRAPWLGFLSVFAAFALLAFLTFFAPVSLAHRGRFVVVCGARAVQHARVVSVIGIPKG